MLTLLCACAALPAAQIGAPADAVVRAAPAEQAAPTPCPAPPARPAAEPEEPALADVDYDSKTNTIRLRRGEPTDLPGLAVALGRPELLRELAPGEWLLAANLEIAKGAELRVAGPAVRWLKLRSDAESFVWVKARGGDLSFVDTCVSSWDAGRAGVDEEHADGRSFVLARDGAQMVIRRSAMRHLGYMANESYGVSYRLKGTGGEVVDSDLGHNFYGLYTFEVRGLLIRNNDVHHSVRYGIDPHTDSRDLVIEGNRAYGNGKHGIILAEGVSDSVIRDNLAYDNALHGIVLYDDSNDNLVTGNRVYGNGRQGINVNGADDNRIVGNTVYANGADGIGLGGKARDNRVADNTVRDNAANGIYLYSGARGTTVEGNTVHGNRRNGIYVKAPRNRITGGNRVYENAVGVRLSTDDPPELSRERNEIFDNREADVIL